MYNVQYFTIAPSIPQKLQFLETLSRNLWWCWHLDACELFQRIDPRVWKLTRHNPIDFLNRIPQKQLERLAKDDSFVAHMERVREHFEAALGSKRNGDAALKNGQIAYFSLEYGIHESVRLYAGGLGCLAGDHLKEASDMHLPLIAIGLLYRQGYFRQYLNDDGWQQESFDDNELHLLPLRRACGRDGHPVQIAVPMPDGLMHATVWRIDVGRIPLFLLDTNISQNPPEYRRVTARLYDNDRHIRLRQELLLGIGGVRALNALGYDPPVHHMNEGHAAFLCLARLSHLMKTRNLDLNTALEVMERSFVFTTHTPVPAGNETFPVDMLRPHLEALSGELGIPADKVLSWGQAPGHAPGGEFGMTILGLRMAHRTNGVSRLHGHIERKMWHHLWPGRPEDEVPIRHITNGVHVPSWLSPELAELFNKYIGSEWRQAPGSERVIAQIHQIPDDAIWRAHEHSRSQLVRYVREAAEAQISVRSAARSEVDRMKAILNHDTLTLGFARRFATYKRATLLLRDPERLEALLTNKDRPVQLIFAGKAHPADDGGKELIRQLVHFARKANVRDRIVFLENYDIQMARYLVQGVDAWVNTPRRPYEASGTSGMKAAVNGALHVSILDGWWVEGYRPECGWAIGHGEEYDHADYQDRVEAHALYNLLENEVVPFFYNRPDEELPLHWIRMMKASICMAMESFTSHRMLTEYHSLFYGPALKSCTSLLADDARKARALLAQRDRLARMWHAITLDPPSPDRDISLLHVGDRFNVTTTAHLGDLKPDEVQIEVYHGPVDADNRIAESHSEPMALVEQAGPGRYRYRQEIDCQSTGRYGLTARAIPKGEEWTATMPGFITWAAPG